MHTGCRWLPIPLCRRAFVDDARLWREVVPISRDVDLRDEVLRVQGRGRACRWRWARLDLLRIREFFPGATRMHKPSDTPLTGYLLDTTRHGETTCTPAGGHLGSRHGCPQSPV